MGGLDDSPLLPKIARGDDAAFAAVVGRYGGLVWSLARRRFASVADAEDAVQEIFLELWRSADRFDPGRARETTFVAMIARRRLIDRVRKATRERAGLEMLSRQPTPERTASDAIESHPDASRVALAIRGLPAGQSRVLDLSLTQGLSHREIAETTDLPIGTVKSHLRRGLERVRQTLAGERR